MDGQLVIELALEAYVSCTYENVGRDDILGFIVVCEFPGVSLDQPGLHCAPKPCNIQLGASPPIPSIFRSKHFFSLP